MQKPNNYENVKAGGYTPPALGGHHIIIKKVVEGQSKKGKPMITVLFDFADNDVQPGLFMEEFKNDTRENKKWSRSGTAYIVTVDENGDCSKNLKRFITSYEQSNGIPENGAVWGDKFAEQFVNKRIGGVYGEVENEYNGKRSMRSELRWFCTDDKVDGVSIPDPVYLKNAAPTSNNDFTAIPDNLADLMPWG